MSIDEAIDNILNFSENSYNIFKSVKTDEKRKILNLIFSNFILDGKNVEIEVNGEESIKLTINSDQIL